MPTRKYKTDPAQLLAEGQQIVHTTSDAKYRVSANQKMSFFGGMKCNFCGQHTVDMQP